MKFQWVITMDNFDNLNVIIKNEIAKKFGSLAVFSREMQVAYTTLSNQLNQNLKNSKFETILRVCEKLDITLFDIDEKSYDDNDIDFLTKLTALDEHGEYMVNTVLEQEYERIMNFNTNIDN